MKTPNLKALGIISTFGLFLGGVYAETMVLTFQEGTSGYSGTVDADMYEENPMFSNGGNDEYHVGVTGPLTGFPQGARRRTAIRFDLSSIPAGAEVTGVTLELTISKASAGGSPTTSQSLHPISKEWGEGTVNSSESGGPGNTGDMTWSSNKLNSETWTNPGGDYGPADATVVVGTSGIARWSSPAMAATVNGWLSSSSTNHGWMLVGDESGTVRTGRAFWSSESILSVNRPKLIVEIEIPTSEVRGWYLY